MRLDKFLCDMNLGTRKEVKEIIKKGQIKVNDHTCTSSDYQIREGIDNISYAGKALTYQKFFYYILHKPAGYVTATRDEKDKTVMDLIPKELLRKDLYPVGRLDKDTTGLLLITNDGELGHKLLSSKYHVWKTYYATLKDKISFSQCEAMEKGLDIGDEKLTLPAKCVIIQNDDSKTIISLSIQEGRYHQVKRMANAIGNEVTALKRVSFGSLVLEDDLPEGGFRSLSDAEVKALQNVSSKEI